MSRKKWPEAIQRSYRQRWRIWIIACLAHTVGLFHRASISPMADRLMADFNISATVLGSLGAVYFYFYAAMQMPAGTLADTLGPRKTITIGLLLSAAGALTMSQAQSFGVIYAGRIMVGFGSSVIWLNVIKLIMEWFRSRELATITGLSSSIVNAGQLAATIPLAIMIISMGWRMSLVSIAQITFGIAAVAWFIIKDSPVKAGLPTIAELDGKTGSQDIEAHDAPGLSLAKRFKLVLSNKRLCPLFFVHFGVYGSFATFFHNWTVIYLMQTYGITRDLAANFVFIAVIGMMTGAPSAGFLADRVLKKRWLPMIIFSGISFLSWILLSFWNGGHPPLEMLYPICFFIGFGMGSVSLVFTSVRYVTPPSVRGTATGLVNSGGFICAAIAQPLFGYLLDRGWLGEVVDGARIYPLGVFQQGLLMCCGLAAVGFIGALINRDPYRKHSQPSQAPDYTGKVQTRPG